jgi:diaminopropionate ammonia-lyase
VGSLAAAAVRRYPAEAGGTRVLGVESQGADCIRRSIAAARLVETAGPFDSRMAGLNCGRPSASAWPLLREGLAAAVTITGTEAEEAAQWLAADGVFTTPTGAAGLAGLAQWLSATPAAGAASVRSGGVLLIATEGDPLAEQ